MTQKNNMQTQHFVFGTQISFRTLGILQEADVKGEIKKTKVYECRKRCRVGRASVHEDPFRERPSTLTNEESIERVLNVVRSDGRKCKQRNKPPSPTTPWGCSEM
jgi:hypothetical protein